MNISEALNFCIFSWLQKKESWKKMLPIWLSYIIFYAFIAAIVFYFISDLYVALSSNTFDQYLKTLMHPNYLNEFMGKAAVMILFILILVIAFAIVVDYIYFSLLKYALKQRKVDSQKLTFNLFSRLIILQILIFLSILFYPQDTKLLAIQWISLLLFIFSLVFMSATPFSFLLILFFIPYILIAIHNGIRYMLAIPSLLISNNSFSNSLKNSWNVTKGRFWDVFVTNLAVTITMGLLLAGLSFVFSFALSFALGIFVKNQVISYIISDSLVNILFSPVGYFVQAFLIAFIYSELFTVKKKSS